MRDNVYFMFLMAFCALMGFWIHSSRNYETKLEIISDNRSDDTEDDTELVRDLYLLRKIKPFDQLSPLR